jgi:hypothetical protein
MSTAPREPIASAHARLRTHAPVLGGGGDPLSSYRCLALTVIKTALNDVVAETCSQADRDSAREFLVGSPIMRHWCRVAGLDPRRVIRQANHFARRGMARGVF